MADITQGSPEWHAARLGKVTASRLGDIVTKTQKGAYSAYRAAYMLELMAERLTGAAPDRFVNAAMQWGTDHEDAARQMYSFGSEAFVEAGGFYIHPRIAEAGASPDGLVDDDGQIEIKCPNTATHLETMMAREVPAKHAPQIQWQLACTGRQWCDFISYDPRLPPDIRIFVCRVERDDALIEAYETEVVAFLVELDARIADLRQPVGVAA